MVGGERGAIVVWGKRWSNVPISIQIPARLCAGGCLQSAVAWAGRPQPWNHFTELPCACCVALRRPSPAQSSPGTASLVGSKREAAALCVCESLMKAPTINRQPLDSAACDAYATPPLLSHQQSSRRRHRLTPPIALCSSPRLLPLPFPPGRDGRPSQPSGVVPPDTPRPSAAMSHQDQRLT